MCDRIIAVGFKAPTYPLNGLDIGAEDKFGDTKPVHPSEGAHIAGRKPERLLDVTFAFRAPPNEYLRKSHHRMSFGQIVIKRQRLFAFPNRLRGASCEQL